MLQTANRHCNRGDYVRIGNQCLLYHGVQSTLHRGLQFWFKSQLEMPVRFINTVHIDRRFSRALLNKRLLAKTDGAPVFTAHLHSAVSDSKLFKPDRSQHPNDCMATATVGLGLLRSQPCDFVVQLKPGWIINPKYRWVCLRLREKLTKYSQNQMFFVYT